MNVYGFMKWFNYCKWSSMISYLMDLEPIIVVNIIRVLVLYQGKQLYNW